MDVEVASHRKHKNFDIVKFKGLYHINDVEKYKGCSLKIAEENLTDLDDGEFYYHEIIGLDVYEGNTLIGQVKEILQPGANDVWVVKRKGKKTCSCHIFHQWFLMLTLQPVVLRLSSWKD